MTRYITPPDIHPPFANYHHAVEVPAGARLLFVSGQLGVAADGTVPAAASDQAALAFDNVLSILAAAGMAADHIVRLNTYLTDPADLRSYMAVRDRYVGEPPPASTLLVVKALARPRFKIEIEAVAAAPAAGESD